ncbi:hypothetical protein FQN57_000490 [Myotisia sp. PD_48]|nr:hypothetical protein FQN57_000490 [Myotisia sp. PD_48]
MPSPSNTSHPRSQSPAPQGSRAQLPLRSADVAKRRSKKSKDAPRDEHEDTKAEAKAIPDYIEEPDLLGQSPDSILNSHFAMRVPQSTVGSPVLDALGAFVPSQEPDITTRTDSWARSIPFGKSPPIYPSDAGAVGESPPNLALPTQGESFRHFTPSASPPQGKARPLSFAEGYSNSPPASHLSRDRHQRHSISSHRLSGPPPPHMPQPHFYYTPDVEIPGVPTPSLKQPQEHGHSFCAIDTLPPTSQKAGRYGGNVIMVGRDGCLEVLAVDNARVKTVGSIKGLPGRVIDAKILTWTAGPDPFAAARPLVALSIHGLADESSAPSSGGSDETDIVPSVSTKQATHPNKRDETPHVQTKVQVYSLRTQELISTLFVTKPLPCVETFPGLSPYIPPPTGNLRLLSSGNLVILASGTSGEVLIFGPIHHLSAGVYQCLGKVWTNVQPKESRRYSNSSASTDTDDVHSDSGRSPVSIDVPILSVSGRWLAVVSPSPTRVSLHGTTPPRLTSKKIYGLDAHMPPPRPSVTCGVDSGEGESLLNRVARGVTQEVFKGARWIGDQGLQTWNNYWNRDSQSSQTMPARRPYTSDPPHGADMLPPTHAQETQTPSKNEPDLVSIFDLKPLEDAQDAKASHFNPIATFQPPHGCSFLSFSPTGLMLLTSSKKGDVHCVWDLMQIRHCRARAFIAEDPPVSSSTSNPPAAHVRRVAWYARLTASTISDVIWTTPHGEHLAIVTKKGTIHAYDIPQGAFRWPPLRRVAAASSSHPESVTRDDMPDENSRNPFSAAVKLVGDTTHPFLAAMRDRAPSIGTAFTASKSLGMTSAVGVRGGKAVAAGLSKSVGAATETVNHFRHAGDNRLYLTGFRKETIGTKAAWVGDERDLSIGVIDGGSFKLYQVGQSSSAQRGKKQAQLVIGGKILAAQLPPAIQAPYAFEQPLTRSSDAISGFWSAPNAVVRSGHRGLKSPPFAQAEIESNAPYQPFHTDRRVRLFVFTPEFKPYDDSDIWVFGDDIPTTKVYVPSYTHSDEDSGAESDAKPTTGEIENLISLGVGDEVNEHVVITTRRKRKHTAASASKLGDDDGFFEDDCDVLDFARDRV